MYANFAISPETGQLLVAMIAMGGKYRKAADAAARAVAESCVVKVKTGIETQVFPAAPLTPEWVVRKRRLGLDPRVFIATRDYVDSIGVEKAGVGAYGITADMRKLALLEYGTRNQPPRPHWEPAIQETRGEVDTILRKTLFAALFGSL